MVHAFLPSLVHTASASASALPHRLMRTKLLLVAVSACILIASCGGHEGTASSSANGGTMVVAVPSDAQTIFPPQVIDGVGAAIRDNLYDRLADMGDDMNTVGDKGFTPHLADRWDWSRDSLSITFHLNPRARWHDGQPVRASDVRYSYQIFRDPKVGASVSSEIANIDSVSVPDSLTAVVWYKQRLPWAFCDFGYQIENTPEHVFKGVPSDQLRTSELA